MKAMIRTPRHTPTATPILIPSLDSGEDDALLVLVLLLLLLLEEEIGSVVIEGALVAVEEEGSGSVEVEDVSAIDAVGDDTTVSVTFSVILSVVITVVLSVILIVSFATAVPCELTPKIRH